MIKLKLAFQLALLISVGIGFSQQDDDIKILDIDLVPSLNPNYLKNEIPKSTFKNYIESSILANFPEKLSHFKFNPDQKLQNDIKSCQIKVNQLRHSQAKKTKNNLIKQQLRACYGKYAQNTPKIRFAFENQNANKIYHINKVKVYLYSSNNSMGVNDNYFSNKNDEREALIINTKQLHKMQKTLLSKSYPLDDGGLALILYLFESENWQGDFTKNRILVDFSFEFSNGQIIRSSPLLIDL